MGQTHYPSKKSLRASSLSKLDNMVNSNSIFMRRCAKFSTKWYEILNFNKPTCIYKHPYNLIKNLFLHFSQFSPLYSPLLVQKTILTILTNTPFFNTSAIFHLSFL